MCTAFSRWYFRLPPIFRETSKKLNPTCRYFSFLEILRFCSFWAFILCEKEFLKKSNKHVLQNFEVLKPNLYCMFFLGLAVIHDYQGEGAILLRKCHTRKDCPGDLTQPNRDDVKFDSHGRLYQHEVVGPCGPGLRVCTKFSIRLCKKKGGFHVLTQSVAL